jgi:hypothetical protein
LEREPCATSASSTAAPALTLAFVTPEYGALSMVGGLGVFVAHLAEALARREDVAVHVITPDWASARASSLLDDDAADWRVARFTLDLGGRSPAAIASLHSTTLHGVHVHLLRCKGHFEGGPYEGFGLGAAVERARHSQGQGGGGLGFERQIGQHVLHQGLGDQRFAKSLALAGVVQGQAERLAHQAAGA